MYFSNSRPEKAFSLCGVVRVSKLRFSFNCKIFQLKMLIIIRNGTKITTYLHSIRAATVTALKYRIQSTYTWLFAMRTRQPEAAWRIFFSFLILAV